jgi:hypothetical protein
VDENQLIYPDFDAVRVPRRSARNRPGRARFRTGLTRFGAGCDNSGAFLHRTGERSRGDAMTEAEGLACAAARPMLNVLRGTVSDRKLRLFACACCRTWEPIRDNLAAFTALELMEQYADGVIPRPEYAPNRRDAIEAMVRSIRSGHAHSAACKVNPI